MPDLRQLARVLHVGQVAPLAAVDVAALHPRAARAPRLQRQQAGLPTEEAGRYRMTAGWETDDRGGGAARHRCGKVMRFVVMIIQIKAAETRRVVRNRAVVANSAWVTVICSRDVSL